MVMFLKRKLEICNTKSSKILLHIDDGSIKVGKDADMVLWNDNPLSIYAKAEQTMIEGVVYYDAKKRLKKSRNHKKKE
jgi:predicted amidohydrolase YtcJ